MSAISNYLNQTNIPSFLWSNEVTLLGKLNRLRRNTVDKHRHLSLHSYQGYSRIVSRYSTGKVPDVV